MRKQYFSIFVFLLFLLTTSVTRAQKITQEKGLTTAVFTTPSGNIKVYLPDDIRQGDVISGRVLAEPEGRNEKQLARNLAELVKYSIVLNGEKFTVENAAKTIRFTVPADKPVQNSLNLLNVTNPVQQLTIPAKPISEQKPVPAQCIIPGHVVTGSPMTIPGPFDGNAANTQCSIGNQPATVLVESPRTCIVAFPANANGMQQTMVQENGQQPCSKTVSGVDMNVSAGKLNLTKGENTYIDVSITGLQNLQAPALLLLNNLTTDVVAMQPSNNITVPLVPDSVSSGNFNRRFNVQSIRTGGFAVNVNLDFQDIMLTPTPPEDTVPGNGNKKPPVVGDKPDKPPVPVIDIPRNTDTIPELKGKLCVRAISEEKKPAMGGGLVVVEKKWSINRDGFVPLIAEGADFDILKITCTPLKPDCTEGGSEIEVPLSGRVRFEWEIIGGKGPGQFVKLGCSYDKKEDGQKTNGEQVIFMPPYVPLPVLPIDETSVTTEIELRILDDRTLVDEEDRKDAKVKLKDEDIVRKFQIITRRKLAKPEEYEIEIIYTDDKNMPVDNKMPVAPPKPDKKPPKCEATAGAWIKNTDLEKPTIILPDVPDNKKVVLGQWIVLEAKNLRETDILPGINCNTDCSQIIPTSATSEDNVQWSWEISGTGKFAAGNTGRYIIYQLPETMDKGKTEMTISIRVKVFNPDNTQVKEVDPKSKKVVDPKTNKVTQDSLLWSDVVTIKVYQPGVKLSTAHNEWLPTNNEKESVAITSTLMIKEGNVWDEAPAHTCRIHYFDLVDVSNEKGICMNSPLKPDEANSCRDLKIKNEKGHEAYDTVKQAGCADVTTYFMQARTQKPFHSYTINVYSEDFGSWGFLRSFANVNEDSKDEKKQKPYNTLVKTPDMTPVQLAKYNTAAAAYEKELTAYYKSKEDNRKLELPYYTSIPIKFDGKDNRVSIPLDMNNNHIADAGWKTSRNKTPLNDISDPAKDDADDDNEPVGNGFKGDGFTNYEEYRGFMTTPNAMKKGDGESVNIAEGVHVRTNPEIKTLFIHRVDEHLDLTLFESLSKLEIHLINETQYNSDDIGKPVNKIQVQKRWVNFNYTNARNVIEQFGLKLVDDGVYKPKEGILGMAANTSWIKNNIESPAPPNWQFEIRIFTDKVKANQEERKLDYTKKLQQVVAHEMFHGCNVCHHGESPKGTGTGGSSAEEFNKPKPGGLRSGDIYCVMRYDNAGKDRVEGYVPEDIGDRLCTSYEGTNGRVTPEKPEPKGYNRPDTVKNSRGNIEDIIMNGYGDAALNRGDCLHQIQVSARGGQPSPCRKTELRTKIGEAFRKKR